MNADTLLTALLADMDDAVTTRETYTALVTGHGTDEEIAHARRAMNRASARLNRTRTAIAVAQS